MDRRTLLAVCALVTMGSSLETPKTANVIPVEKLKINMEPVRKLNKASPHAGVLVLSEELRQVMERHVLGLCDQQQQAAGYKFQNVKMRSNYTGSCLEEDSRELAGRLAELALRATMLSRSNTCDGLLAASLAHMFGDLARKSSQTPLGRGKAGAASEAKQKARKLSKSQKTKLQAKQKAAIAVKKKAAAVLAASTKFSRGGAPGAALDINV